MNDLVFYTNPQSRGRIAHWMMEETGLPYETVWLEFGPAMKSGEYLSVNPMGKVPALKHGSVVVTEAAAICAYLADRFPQQPDSSRRTSCPGGLFPMDVFRGWPGGASRDREGNGLAGARGQEWFCRVWQL